MATRKEQRAGRGSRDGNLWKRWLKNSGVVFSQAAVHSGEVETRNGGGKIILPSLFSWPRSTKAPNELKTASRCSTVSLVRSLARSQTAHRSSVTVHSYQKRVNWRKFRLRDTRRHDDATFIQFPRYINLNFKWSLQTNLQTWDCRFNQNRWLIINGEFRSCRSRTILRAMFKDMRFQRSNRYKIIPVIIQDIYYETLN